MCPEGAPESGAQYRIEIIRVPLFALAPLSGRIFAWRVPRVETLLPLRLQGAGLVPCPLFSIPASAWPGIWQLSCSMDMRRRIARERVPPFGARKTLPTERQTMFAK